MMTGELDLKALLASMRPVLHPEPYAFVSIDQAVYESLPFEPLLVFFEKEGITLITMDSQASQLGFERDQSWAHITLSVHSSLAAVGFLAAITAKLAQAGISVNPVSACYHDHLFVPWESRDQAMDLLREISHAATANNTEP